MLTARGAVVLRLQGAGRRERHRCTREASHALEKIPDSLLRVLPEHEVSGVPHGLEGSHLARKPRQDHEDREQQERATLRQRERSRWLLV